MSASDVVRRPVRPSLPPTLYALAVAIIVSRGCLGIGAAPPLGHALALATLAALIGGIGLRLMRDRQGLALTVCLCLVVAAVCQGLCTVQLELARRLVEAMARAPISQWEFVVESDASSTQRGFRVRARAYGSDGETGSVWLASEEELSRGDVVRAIGTFSALGDDDWARSSRMQGVWGTVSVARITSIQHVGGFEGWLLDVRSHAVEHLDAFASDERAFLAGCVLGDRRALRTRGLDDLFSRCGMSHLVAVSGAHIAVVGSLVTALVEKWRLKPRVRLGIVLVVTGLFVCVCGAPPSAVRAWAMSGLSAAAVVIGRRRDGLVAASLVGLAMALIDPGVTGQVGYLLSLSCVIALGVFGRYAAYLFEVMVPSLWVPRGTKAERRIWLGRQRRTLLSGLAASLVAQLAGAPIALPLFGQLPLVGPLASVVVTAPMSATLGFGLAAVCSMPLPVFSTSALFACDVVTHLLLSMLRWFAALPLACIPVNVDGARVWAVLIVGCLLLYATWPRINRRWTLASVGLTVVALGCLFASWRYLAPARIVILDVGQGDAILVQDGGAAIMVDTGPDDDVVSALARERVLHIDAIVLTHLHEDHVGGIDDIAMCVGFDELIVAQGVNAEDAKDVDTALALRPVPVVEVGYGDTLQVGGFTMRVISPVGRVSGNDNADSIELLVVYEREGRRLTALLTGDAERDETGAAVARGDVGDIDLLKVGHHGSEVSITADEAQVLSPELSVASAGKGNKYGHPRKECIDILEEVGSDFLCTIDCGDIDVRPSERGVVVLRECQQ